MTRFLQTTQLIRFSVLTVIVLIFLAIMSYFTRMDAREDRLKQQYIAEAQHQLEFTDREFENVRRQMSSRTKIIASDHRVVEMLLSPTAENKNLLEETWFSIIENEQWFDEIRLIDEHGKELVVAEYDEATGTISFDSTDILGDFSMNEEFKGFANSLPDSASSWGVTVIDGEQVVESARMYVSYPVAKKGSREGYVVVTFNLWILVNALNYSPLNHIEAEIVDDEGYFFSAEDANTLFGNIIEENAEYNVKLMYPIAWQQMSMGLEGTIVENDTTIIYKRLSSLSDENQAMGIVRISDELIYAELKYAREALVSQSLSFVLIGVLMMVPGIYVFSQYQIRVLDSTLAKAALEGMSAVVIADEQGRIVKVNNEFVNMTGYTPSKVIGRRYEHLLVPSNIEQTRQQRENALNNEGVWQGELMAVRADGSLIHTQLREQRGVKEKNLFFNIVSLIDISSQKALEEKLLYLSEHDSLTEIWNRRKFDSELHKYASLKTRYPAKEPSALAIIDIDHFKAINDEFGHDVGDKVIQAVAKYFQDSLRVTDFVARVGGEEFAVIMPHTDKQVAFTVLERLRDNLHVEDDDLPNVTVSIGISDMSNDADKSYKLADTALYTAKQHGRNQVQVG